MTAAGIILRQHLYLVPSWDQDFLNGNHEKPVKWFMTALLRLIQPGFFSKFHRGQSGPLCGFLHRNQVILYQTE